MGKRHSRGRKGGGRGMDQHMHIHIMSTVVIPSHVWWWNPRTWERQGRNCQYIGILKKAPCRSTRWDAAPGAWTPLVLGLSRSGQPTQRGRKIKYSHPFPYWMKFTPAPGDDGGKVLSVRRGKRGTLVTFFCVDHAPRAWLTGRYAILGTWGWQRSGLPPPHAPPPKTLLCILHYY